MTSTATEIFYVDDSPDDRLFARMSFERGGYPFTMKSFGTGFAAILDMNRRIARREKLPCLLVADHYMPIMDGPELLRLIRDNPAMADVVLAICSGGDDLAERQAAAGAGARHFLSKPLDLALCAAIVLDDGETGPASG